ncbi:hypothetical protein F9U64_21100 [Gracilibacillus oryzae]|uniref:Uncharacterized protein n=1 Tax=Gracilibacillus oryzae TaxID=1672701 RepID=A0A7C8GR33_9BACI|nr:2TM domain-containing protein [Gracilibacillus oryzae]KAB8125966.1 hypothetical protein F9U64_21100 [Gracilibacillus oryzae]
MNLLEEMGTRADFFKHLTLFVIVHILVNVLLAVDADIPFFSGMKQSIQEGKIWFYHEKSGLFITMVWLVILVAHGSYLFLFKKKSE